MSGDDLFDDLPETEPTEQTKRRWAGAARLREPVRDQVELRPVDLESLLALDHPARLIWDYVGTLDLSPFEEQVDAREHGPGQAPPSPKLFLAVWLYATSEGVGSARALDRLCRTHDAYRWLCGGVSLNYDNLSRFRIAHPELLDRLLKQSVASLSAADIISLDEVVQDGVRVRASAGAASFRRRKTLEKELRKAEQLVEQLKREIDGDPDASNRRIRAAQERAARERKARVDAAIANLDQIEAHRARRGRDNRSNKNKGEKPKEPRASTTDPEARVMKMADGGFRPAYNCQVSTVAGGQIVAEVDPSTVGSDRGLMWPMLEAIHNDYDHWPERYLVDGGFHNNEAIERAATYGTDVYAPPPNNKHKTDPLAPREDDGPGVAAWRSRMRSEEGKAVYKRRAPGECINARFRNWGLRQFTVRGRQKVRAILLWFAIANNILAGHRLAKEAA